MIIRNEQMVAFQKCADSDFERRAIRYLQETFPAKCAEVGRETLPAVFREGRRRAANYQCFGEQGIVVYLYLMFRLGSDFDSDPQVCWAGKILGDTARHEIARMNALWKKAHEHAFLVNGGGNEHLRRAVARILQCPLLTSSEQLHADFKGEVVRLLKSFYPEKCRIVGETVISKLIEAAEDKAARYGIMSRTGARLVAVFMLVFGSGFDADPLLAWAGKILSDESVSAPNEKVSRLHSEGLKHLNFVCRS